VQAEVEGDAGEAVLVDATGAGDVPGRDLQAVGGRVGLDTPANGRPGVAVVTRVGPVGVAVEVSEGEAGAVGVGEAGADGVSAGDAKPDGAFVGEAVVDGVDVSDAVADGLAEASAMACPGTARAAASSAMAVTAGIVERSLMLRSPWKVRGSCAAPAKHE
jgi:hypothetical protein